MNELLSNPAVQTALVVAIVAGLNAFVAWLKQKFPTQAASIEANWCYLQPIVEYAMQAAKMSLSRGVGNGTPADDIISKAVAEFSASYRKMEGKDATVKEIAAARAEITSAVSRVTGG